jgi:guanosine-3',5'-bis(diphosphate) 3'-pyrophosphohydrolase
MERTLDHHGLTVDDIDQARLETVLKERKIDSIDDLLSEIGLGNQMASIVVKRLLGNVKELENSEEGGPLAIKGTEGLVVSYARCCHPIPGDPIIGHVSAGRGIVIHTDTCRNMVELRNKPEEIMGVRWEPNVAQEFSVELRVQLEHQRGIIAVVASTVTEANANIERINMVEKDAHLGIVNMVINVQDRIHLANVIKRLRTIKAISRIVRVRN